MPLSSIFQSYDGDSSHCSCLSWVSPVLGWGSYVSCPRTSQRNNPEDPVWLKPRTPGLQVKYFTTEQDPRKKREGWEGGEREISHISWQQLKYLCISCISSVQGRVGKCLAQGHSHKKQRIYMPKGACQ